MSGGQLDWAEEASLVVSQRFEKLNTWYIQLIADRLKKIGSAKQVDLYRLEQMRDIGADISLIKLKIAEQVGYSMADLEQLYGRVAVEMGKSYDGLLPAEVYSENGLFMEMAKAQFVETAGLLENLSNTTVVADGYKAVVDIAVSAVQGGTESYTEAIRGGLKRVSYEGLRVRSGGTVAVEYESGLTRRLDTAMRMNVLDGARALFQRMTDEAGKAFGADGVELSAHMLCAADHVPYQGRQYSHEAYRGLLESLHRRIGVWNCKHFAYPVLLGVSEPAYTDEELERYKRNSEEIIEIEGKARTRYEWSQQMRKLETSVRRQKDIAVGCKAVGDDYGRRLAQAKINDYLKIHKAIAEATGVGVDSERMVVSGFYRVWKGVDELEKKGVKALENCRCKRVRKVV